MRIPLIYLLTFILVFSTAIELPSNPLFKDVKASVCDYTKINNGIKQFSEFFRADNYTSPESIAVFILGVSSTVGPATECLTKIGDWVTGINTVSKTLFTDVCLNPEETQTKNDVCCNTDLEDKQCCTSRNHVYPQTTINGFNTILNGACGEPEKAKQTLTTFVDKFYTKLATCTLSVKKKLKRDFDIFTRMTQCWTEVYTKTPDCTNDSDCDGGNGICNPLDGKCMTTGQENVEPLLRCIFRNIPDWMKRVFKLKLGLKGADSDAKLFASFKQNSTVSECYIPSEGNNFVFTRGYGYTTEAICLIEKVCNIPGGCNNGTGQCVVGCGLNGICSNAVDVFKTESACKEFGYCFGNGYLNGLSFFNATTCAEKKMCTDILQCENKIPACTEATCVTKGRCVGFPFSKATCVANFQYDQGTGQKTCLAGETMRDFGCESTKGSVECIADGGTMYQVPTTEADCLNLKICVNNETRSPSLMNQQSCSKCGGTYQNAFAWVPAEWKSAKLYQPQKWVTPKMVSKNRWVQGIDPLGLTKILTSILYLQLLNSYKSLYQCAYYPMVKVAESIACDCGTPKAPAGTKCYEPIQVPVGTFRVFSGIAHRSRNLDYDVTPDKNAVSAIQDFVDAQVIRTEAKSAISASADLLFVLASNQTSGFLASDGYSVQTSSGSTLAGKTNLCIKRTVSTVPSGYTAPGFATIINGVVTKSSVVITNTDFSSEMCGDVTDTKIYYMAFFGDGSQTPTSNSSTFTFSAVIFVAMILSLLF